MNVKPEDLPSLPIEWKSALPKCSGIYFAIDSEGRIQYIGRSKNINQRWAGHHRNEQLLKIGGVRIAWLEISDHSLLPDIESALIEWFVPPLNRVVVSREEECVLTSLRISAGEAVIFVDYEKDEDEDLIQIDVELAIDALGYPVGSRYIGSSPLDEEANVVSYVGTFPSSEIDVHLEKLQTIVPLQTIVVITGGTGR